MNRTIAKVFLLHAAAIFLLGSCGGGGGGSSAPAANSGGGGGSGGGSGGTVPIPSLSVTTGVESVSASWAPVAGATAYNVYYTPLANVSKANATKLENVTSPLSVRGLAPGMQYQFAATAVNGADETALSTAVTVTPQSVPESTINYELIVKETKGISRANEVVHNGVPLPKSLGLFDPSAIHLEKNGAPIDADFEVLSRWGGGLADTTKPIQWLLVTFRSTVAAYSSESYFIVSGARANVGNKLTITQDGTKVQVNTGTAQFSISKTSFNVLDSLALSTAPATTLAGGASGNASIVVFDEALAANKPTMTALPPDEVVVERATDLFATVKVSGYFDNSPYASVKWRYVARYNFVADSPTVLLDFSYAIMGNKVGSSSIDAYDRSGFMRVDKVTLALPVSPGANANSYAATDIGAQEVSDLGTVAVGARQKLRSSMTASPGCDLVVGGVPQGGICTFANKPFAGKWGAAGGVGASIRQMRWYEPQSLHALATRLEIEIVADKQRLGPYMGAFAGIAISATAGSQAQLAQGGEAALTRIENGLVAWPTRVAVARSSVLDELWDGTPNPDADKYWDQITSLTANTSAGFISRGMYGFMTYGLPVREWRLSAGGFDEFGDQAVWDGYFMGGTFTDYHNAMGNVVRQFAQSNESALLHELSFPAARRTLHTHIIQGDSTSVNQFRIGWGSIGYGGYRSNFNSSHSYFDNLYNYYYLTGDKAVLDSLIRGGSALRSVYSRDGSNALIPSDQPPAQSFMGTVGRADSQQAAIYWFLGHASSDPSFLEDFKNNLERGVDLHTALLSANGKEYAFISSDILSPTAATGGTDQIWMSSLYFLHNLWSYYQEFGDVALGTSGVTIGRYFSGVNRSLWDYASTVSVGGTGQPSGVWANSLQINWTGATKGGAITSVVNPLRTGTSDDYLYLSGKSILPSTMFRAARINHSRADYDRAKIMAIYALNAGVPGASAAANKYPWMKETSLRFIRMHGPAGYLSGGQFPSQ